MGTNFYRIPKESEMKERKEKLEARIKEMKIDVKNIDLRFRTIKSDSNLPFWDTIDPWDEFIEGISVHIGKRSGGWKFLWNWNDSEHYDTKEELFSFIRSGRIIDEYGKLVDSEEFIEMATNWCLDGWDNEKYLEEHPDHRNPFWSGTHEEYIEDLRVSSYTDFS